MARPIARRTRSGPSPGSAIRYGSRSVTRFGAAHRGSPGMDCEAGGMGANGNEWSPWAIPPGDVAGG
ncbi:hypothetical protein GCM10018962_55570 [Dactylosporangium matsuzakiense]